MADSPDIDPAATDPETLTEAERDALPFGLIGLDAAGTVTSYNLAESRMSGLRPAAVVGRNFFRDVAPCTNQPAFHGRFLEGVRQGNLNDRFRFVFGFASGPVRVGVTMQGGAPGRYWMKVQVLGVLATSMQRAASQAQADVDRRVRAEPVDPTLCEREPIHVAGAVQAHAVMLALDPETLAIRSYSDNLEDLFEGAHAPGQPASEVLPAGLIAQLKDALQSGALADPAHPVNLRADFGGAGPAPFTVLAHLHAGNLILECERNPAHPADFNGATAHQAQDAMAAIRGAATLAGAAQAAVDHLRGMTGFERILVYRFDAEWNGQAVAEAKHPTWAQSLMGLRFPASDIPAQARALYTKSLSRFVVDRDAVPAHLLTAAAATNVAVDLTYARTRALSPVHLEYQRNLGVNGSMSISIMVDGALWGLVIGHHRKPHYITPDTRILAALVTDAFALRVTEQENVALWRGQQAALAAQTLLLERMAGSDDFVAALTARDGRAGGATLLDLFDAGGASVLVGERVASTGATPPDEVVLAIGEWLRSQLQAGQRVFATDRLPEMCAAAATVPGIASGLLAAFITGESRRDHLLLWFRPEQPATIVWGGNPNKPVLADASTRAILPRRSFERWVEERGGRSEPWAHWQEDIAEALAIAIEGVVLRQGRRIAELTTQQAALTRALEQKDTMAREIDHRVKNSLQIVAGVMRMQARSVTDPAAKLVFEDTFARVMSVARVHDSLHRSETMEAVDLGETLRDLCRDLSEGMAGAERRLAVDVDMGLIVPSQTAVALSLIATELVTNALKYAYAQDSPGEVAVSVKAVEGGMALRVSDQGRGLPEGWSMEPKAQPAGTRGGGLGMRVIRAMLQQIGAQMQVEPASPGVSFTVLV